MVRRKKEKALTSSVKTEVLTLPRPKRYQKVLGKKFNIKGKTTTKRGRREYMRKYMKLYRRKRKGKRKKR